METTNAEDINMDVYDPPSKVKHGEHRPDPMPQKSSMKKNAKLLNLRTCLLVVAIFFICCLLLIAGYLIGKTSEKEIGDGDSNEVQEFKQELEELKKGFDDQLNEIKQNLLITNEEFNASAHQENGTGEIQVLTLLTQKVQSLEAFQSEANLQILDISEEKENLLLSYSNMNRSYEELRASQLDLNLRLIEYSEENANLLHLYEGLNKSFGEFTTHTKSLQEKLQEVEMLDPCINANVTPVACMALDPKWITIQRRFLLDVDFYRKWVEYEDGFRSNNEYGDFWIGLKTINELTNNGSTWVMRTDFESWNNNRAYWIEYTAFSVGDAATNYRLTLGIETAGSFSERDPYGWKRHDGMSFSTYDDDNDAISSNCASNERGGWWYYNCGFVNLNALPATNAEQDGKRMEYYVREDLIYHVLKNSLIRIRPILN